MSENLSVEEDVSAVDYQEITTWAVMKPVDLNQRLLLDMGISQHGLGRRAYLQLRSKTRPFERYEFPMTSSAVYGWRFPFTKTLEHKTPCSENL